MRAGAEEGLAAARPGLNQNLRQALATVAEAVHGVPALASLGAFSLDELVERHPRALLQAVAASVACRERLAASAAFAVLLDGDGGDDWRRLIAPDEAPRLGAVAAILGADVRDVAEGEPARLREQNASLRRRVDELSRARRREAAALADAEVQRLRARLDRSDGEVERLRKSEGAAAVERDEALAELRSLRRSLDAIATLQGRAELALEAVGRELASALAPSPAAPPAEWTAHQARAGALEKAQSSLRVLLDALSAPVPAPAVSGVRSRDLTVTPLGGGEEIGGSCLLIEVAGRRLLVDCGARPGATRMEEIAPPGLGEALRRPIDAIVLTHAHNDHAGYVPAVLRGQRRVPPVIATPATAALLPPMWTDSVRLLEDRRRLALRFSPEADGVADAPFGATDVESALAALRTVPFGRWARLGDIEYTLFPAGHILGAAGVVLRVGDRMVAISGDVCDQPQATVSAADLDQVPTEADLLVLESTYCHDDHPGREAEVARFLQDVEDVVRGGGVVLVPAFGLGRAQEVAMILRERLPHVQVLVDGIARGISRIYEDQSRVAGRPMRLLADNVLAVEGDRRMVAGSFRRGVVITTSGMLTGGPAVEWARAVLPQPKSALFLCGYQDEESPGRRLLELADEPPERRSPLQLSDGGRVVSVPVRARVARYQLSAHADRTGLISIVDRLRPAATMLVHGNRRDQAGFRAALNASGRPAIATRRWAPG